MEEAVAAAFTQPEELSASAVPVGVAPARFMPTELKQVMARQIRAVVAAVPAIRAVRQVQVLAVMAVQELLSFDIWYQHQLHQTYTSIPTPVCQPKTTSPHVKH
jgi:hypothetical protein